MQIFEMVLVYAFGIHGADLHSLCSGEELGGGGGGGGTEIRFLLVLKHLPCS